MAQIAVRTRAVIGGLVTGLAATAWMESRREKRARTAQIARFMRTAASVTAVNTSTGLDSLPAPVARYLRWALPQNGSMRLVRMSQAGVLRTDVRSERWLPFEAEHLASPHTIAFVWNASVMMVPFLCVHVRDALLDGQGWGNVSLLSAITVASDGGTHEINSGALHRFLAESVWYPAALLPTHSLQWCPIDENRALATLTSGDVCVTLEFRFAETGEVTGIYTPARWGKFGRSYEQVPWEGHFRNYRRWDGICVPTEAEVGWYVGGERQTVWKGTITAYQAEPDLP